MSVFLADPSVLTKDKLKSVLVANNVALPDGEQRKGVYVQLYLRNLTCRNTASGAAGAFSSDEELQPEDTTASRSGRKATKKTDRVPPEEMDVTVLTNEDLKDQLLKYGVSAGPIVASTRKVYEKRLQKLLDQGGSDTTPPRAKCTQTGSGYNGTTQHAEQYSDMEGETTPADPEPVPVVERPVRSRGKPSVTPRTLGSRHRTEQEDEPEGDLQVWDVWRKSRRSSRRLDQAVPAGDDADISEMLPVPHERGRDRPLAVPRVPTPLLADEPESSPVRGDSWTEPRRSRMHLAHCARDGFQEKPRGKGLISSSDWCAEMQPSLLNTALLEDGPDSQALSPRSLEARAADTEQKRVPPAKRQTEHRSASTPPSRDLLHVMCRLSPLSTSPHLLSVMDSSPKPPSTHLLMVSTNLPAQQDPLPVTQSSSKERAGSSVAQSIGRQSHSGPSLSPVLPPSGRGSGVLIEKLSCIEQTPKVTERNVLKEMFSSESLNTPTGISATCRRPIKGAAGRPVSDVWLGDLRPRLTEIRRSSSSYTESRSVPRVSAVPFTPSRPMAPPAVQAKARRRVPVWVRLLLLSAVAGFLFLVYQAMETNEMSPFGHGGSNALDSK